MKWKLLSCVQLLATPWTIQFMEFSRPEYWSGYFSLLQGIFPTRDQTQVSHIAGRFFTSWATREVYKNQRGLLFVINSLFVRAGPWLESSVSSRTQAREQSLSKWANGQFRTLVLGGRWYTSHKPEGRGTDHWKWQIGWGEGFNATASFRTF